MILEQGYKTAEEGREALDGIRAEMVQMDRRLMELSAGLDSKSGGGNVEGVSSMARELDRALAELWRSGRSELRRVMHL